MRPGQAPAIRLRFLNGAERGRVVIRRGPECRIGRSRDNDLTLPDHQEAQASAHHAVARHERGQWWIHDLGSLNGTFVNGVRVTRAPFRPGDRLVFGDVECAVVRSGAVAITALAVAGAAAALVAAYVLGSNSRATFEKPAAMVAASTYLVAIDGTAGRRAIGTAFVVHPTLLATNAHVADTLQALMSADPKARGVALRSDADERVGIVEVLVHPRWRRGSLEDDAALLRLERAAEGAPLTLADPATVAALRRGVPLATFGFPTTATDVNHPRGRLTLDVMGDLRDGRYLGTGLAIAPGMSGSPIFLANGVVVGLATGGDFVVAPDKSVRPSGTGVNWGVSTATVHDLLSAGAAARH
jgi:hypothetical protein